ncbi:MULTISPECIES: branched-chain amino acid ABC transporter permease [unclassified Nocardioides]|uniref:branched-chain amino acid ABC transporter permease n=1 Tax=unclassified Nocardioides TaxID=2615069 RepID=UPI000B2ED77F|nr:MULTISPECIES: branched-chain amino acid ABC transporter permease [unclassified Nocardioides]
MNAAQVLNGLALGSLLMVLSSGLAMIYGLRGVANFAHGALYMSGAYIAYSVSDRMSFGAAIVIVPLALAVIGVVLELCFFRPLQHRSHIELGLITFGLALIVERVVILVWGEKTLRVVPPEFLQGTSTVFGVEYPSYRLAIIVIALALAAGLILWLRLSTVGLHIRAASQDIETASIMGINVDKVSLIVVSLGSALAGLAGTLAAPYIALDPGMGNAFLITVLIVVVVGGIGSIAGAMIAGMGLGLIQTLSTVWSPSFAVLVPYLALTIVLLWRPTGLAGKRIS